MVTLSLPRSPVTEDQLIVKINGQQYGMALWQDGEWCLYSLSFHLEKRFPTIYDLLRHVETIEAQDEQRLQIRTP